MKWKDRERKGRKSNEIIIKKNVCLFPDKNKRGNKVVGICKNKGILVERSKRYLVVGKY